MMWKDERENDLK